MSLGVVDLMIGVMRCRWYCVVVRFLFYHNVFGGLLLHGGVVVLLVWYGDVLCLCVVSIWSCCVVGSCGIVGGVMCGRCCVVMLCWCGVVCSCVVVCWVVWVRVGVVMG